MALECGYKAATSTAYSGQWLPFLERRNAIVGKWIDAFLMVETSLNLRVFKLFHVNFGVLINQN